MSVWVLLVYALAVTRLTGLIVADDISAPARQWLIRHLPLHPIGIAVEELLTCFWCASMWVGAAVVAAAWHWGDQGWMFGPALVLAFSQIAGMTSTLGRAPKTAPADTTTDAAVTP